MSDSPRQHPRLRYKTRVCKHYKKGFCRYGKTCKFAHGTRELRNAAENLKAVHDDNDDKEYVIVEKK